MLLTKHSLVLLVSLSLTFLSVSGREFTATDMNTMPKVGVPVADSTKNRYVFTVNTWNITSNKKTQQLHLGKLDAAGVVDTLGATEGTIDFNPLWLPDHQTLLFLSNRGSEGATNFWTVKVSDDNTFGEPAQLTHYPVSVETARIQGNRVAFSAAVYPGLTLQETADKDVEIAASPVKVQEWDKTFVRRWDFFYENKYSHVFLFDVDACTAKSDGIKCDAPVDMMGSLEGDCPSKPFGDEGEYAISPDGQHVAFTTQVGTDKAWSTDLNVYEYDVAAGTAVCITCGNEATDTAPAYSPDGRYLAYLAMKTPRYESDTKHIRIYDREANSSHYVAEDWDRSVDSVFWSEDGATLYAGAADEGYGCYFRVNVADQTVQKLLGEHTSVGLNIIPCGSSSNSGDDAVCALYARSDLAHPAEIFRTNADGTTTQLSTATESAMSRIDMTRYFDLRIPGANNDTIQAWFHKPFNWRSGRKFPLVLYIHGGPESPWEDTFHYRWNPQLIAAQGYAVLAPNFHGSQSFGEEFTRSILEDWGGKPYQDLMKAVDYIVENYDWVDGNRVGAMGASYGGYMINWINSQTDRFKCLVCHDGFFDTFSMYWQTDELYFPDMEFGGIPTDPEAYKRYKKWSPSTYADKMNTPELVIHGALDYRIPEVAAISLFNNLQRRGVDSAFIRFPNADHFILDPNDSIYWHSEVIGWLDKYLK